MAAAAFAAGRLVLPRGTGHADARIDAASGALATVGIAAVVVGCSRGADHGWSASAAGVPIALGVVALLGFVVRQARSANPLLPLWVLTDRVRPAAYLAVAAGVVASFGMFLMLTYQLQVVVGYSPVETGLGFLPLSVAVSASSYGLGSRLMPRVAPRALIGPGLVVAAAALAPDDAPSLQAMERIGKTFQEFDSNSSAMIVLEGDQPLGDADAQAGRVDQ